MSETLLSRPRRSRRTDSMRAVAIAAAASIRIMRAGAAVAWHGFEVDRAATTRFNPIVAKHVEQPV